MQPQYLSRSRLHIKPLEVFNSKSLEQHVRDKIKKRLKELLEQADDSRLQTAILDIVQKVIKRHASHVNKRGMIAEC